MYYQLIKYMQGENKITVDKNHKDIEKMKETMELKNTYANTFKSEEIK